MANPLRKTMVYLGLADEEYDDAVPSAPVAPVASAPGAGRAPVTPLRRPVATRHAAPAGMNEILTVHRASTGTRRSSPRASARAYP
jgi:hypothetical protein